MAQEKTRLSFEMPTAVRDQLDELVKRSRAGSMSEVVRKAIALYELVLEHEAEKGRLVFRHADGSEEVLRVI